MKYVLLVMGTFSLDLVSCGIVFEESGEVKTAVQYYP